MAAVLNSFCHLSSSSPLLPHLASSSSYGDATVSRHPAVSSRAYIHAEACNCISSGYLSGRFLKNSSWVCPQLRTVSPIRETGKPFASFYSRRSSWICSFPSVDMETKSSASLAHEFSHFTQASLSFERRKRRASVSHLKSSRGTEASTEAESEVDTKENEERLPSREATAAVTVAAIVTEAEAISNVLETVEEQEVTDEGSAVAGSFISDDLAAIYAKCQSWQWKGKYDINYMAQGSGPPVVLVHGFGASIGHWRRNIGVLSKTNTVYAIDLLGLGASAKPAKFTYTIETWAEACSDFPAP